MDAVLGAQLQRIETALGHLLTSIITYNPSVSAADELLQTDDELSKELEQLTLHQNNYSRILQLRHESELLDSKIKTSVQLLADIRKDLLAVPLDTPREPVKPVPYKQLLAYAKNISPFTTPPTFRPKPVDGTAPSSQDLPTDNATATANTPAADVMELSAPTSIDRLEDNAAAKALSEEQQAWIADLNNLPFQPWPGEGEMNLGVLKVLQAGVENGADQTDVQRLIERDDETRRAQEVERVGREAEEARRRPSQPRAQQQPGPLKVEEKRQARFGLGDDEDEDEDEDD